MNNAGSIAGYYGEAGSDFLHPFIYQNGLFIDFPNFGGHETIFTGINDHGQITGDYFDVLGVHGFLYSDNEYTIIADPLGQQSEIIGIINLGQVSGRYFDVGSDAVHGFIATPVSNAPEPTSMALLGVGVPGLSWFRRNDRGMAPDRLLRWPSPRGSRRGH